MQYPMSLTVAPQGWFQGVEPLGQVVLVMIMIMAIQDNLELLSFHLCCLCLTIWDMCAAFLLALEEVYGAVTAPVCIHFMQ